jgi:ATP-dependent DNA helicase RecG
VVNAVCHRDYFEKGARVMLEIYDDRVEIVSPGGVCKGITRENFGTISITRNSVLASMLYRIGYIEQMGTGIARMKNAAREAKVAEPEFEFSVFFKVTFKRDAAFAPIERQSVTLSDRKRVVISFLEEHEQARVADLADLMGLSGNRVRALLREMAGDGAVEKVGNNRYAYYVLKH